MKRISETERLIGFAMDATEDALNSAIQSLSAIRNKRFPVEKKVRKVRKPKQEQPKLVTATLPPRTRKAKSSEEEPSPITRKCTNCDWSGEMIAPEPCPECGSKTEAK